MKQWWRWLIAERRESIPMQEAAIITIDDELTFPSPALTSYIEHLERGLLAVAQRGQYRYEGREELNSGLRMFFFCHDAQRFCAEVSPVIRASPIRHAISARWSKNPTSAAWTEWNLD